MSDMVYSQWLQILQSSWLMGLSIIAFVVGVTFYQRTSQRAIFHPLVISTPLIALVLSQLDIDYTLYYQHNGVLNWLLGPATVALAVPLAKHLKQLREILSGVIIAVILGGLFAAISAVFVGLLLVSDNQIVLSLAAKSVTTPLAIIITQELGGLITVITLMVLFTGIVGIIVADTIFYTFKLNDERWQGLVLGITAHAIGTLRAFEKSPRCGAFSTIGMGLNGIWSAFFLIPLIKLVVF